MESLWNAETKLEPRPSLAGEIRTDVCVIGAGMAGVLIGHELRRRGISSVLLERGRIGGGVTGGTTAKITAQHGLLYDRLISELGETPARQYADANLRAVERFAEIVERNQIECGFTRVPSYVYSLDNQARLCREVKAACTLGLPAELAAETSLPFPVKGAVRFPNQAVFQPLAFLGGVAEKLTIYEHTMALEIRKGVVTTQNGTVRADRIVVASHYPFLDSPGRYFLRMHQQRSYVVAIQAPEGAPPLGEKLDGSYIDADDAGFSLRPCGEYILLGGAGHRTGQHENGGSYGKLRQTAQSWYPGAQVAYQWSAQDCMTLSGIPYVGRYAASTPWLFVATGFNKWGMTNSMAAAMILSSVIEGKPSPFSEVFSPQRLTVNKTTVVNLCRDGRRTASGMAKSIFGRGKGEVEQIPNGHGGIVRYQGKKVGAYRDEKGNLFLVSPKCTHLGCQLEWNPDEHTWDCPCHGSRFGYDGHVIDTPALKPLERY